jgi:hypothetical protein
MKIYQNNSDIRLHFVFHSQILATFIVLDSVYNVTNQSYEITIDWDVHQHRSVWMEKNGLQDLIFVKIYTIMSMSIS